MCAQSIAPSVLAEVLQEAPHEVAPGGVATRRRADERGRRRAAHACAAKRDDIARVARRLGDDEEGRVLDQGLFAALARRSNWFLCQSDTWRSASSRVSS